MSRRAALQLNLVKSGFRVSIFPRMKTAMKFSVFSVFVSAFLFAPAAGVMRSQVDISPTRLRSPATVKGFIGGESHDRYVVRARKGQIMTVRISWRREGDNHAEFGVQDSRDFDHYVEFGKASDDGRLWRGNIPKTRDYYIDVVAHPSAHYTLRVTVK
jgi:hypothetical protein